MLLFTPFRLDPFNQRLWRGDHRLALKPKAFAVLRYLAERPERLITKTELLAALWPGVHVGPAVLKTHMNEIREVLADRARAPRYIETVPGHGYRFVAPVQQDVAGDSPARTAQRKTEILVGRERERAALERALTRAQQGERQLVFVTGEPGIGKTTLVDGFLAPLRANPAVAVAWGQCVEQYGAGEAYLPVLEALSRLLRRPDSEQLWRVLRRSAPTWVLQMPELLDADGLQSLERATVAMTPARMLRELAQALPQVAEVRPLILLLEDLHWADHSTLTLLSYLARQSDPARLLIVGTFRSQEVRLNRHPLWEIQQSLVAHERCEEIALQQLDEREVAHFLDVRFVPHQLPEELGQRLHAHTAGNPLFLVRVVDAMIKRDQVRETEGHWRLSAELAAVTQDVPPSVTALMEAEAARLTELERDVLGAASVAGAEFWVAAVAAALQVDPVRVEDLCVRWARAGRFLRLRERSETGLLRCEFIHALYQRVILESLSPARQTQLHGRIAVWLETTFASDLHACAAELAMHFERGPEPGRAIRHHELAGKKALARCAYREAMAHLESAQTLNARLPGGEDRLRNELSLLLVLGIPAAMINGYGSPQVEGVYLRAQDLCRELGAPQQQQQQLQIAVGLSICYVTRGAYVQAKAFADHAERLAQSEGAATARQEANLVQLMASFHLGELSQTRGHMARAIELYGSERSGPAGFSLVQDLSVATATVLCWPLWLLGYPEQALSRGEQALALATERSDDFAMVQSLGYLVALHLFRGDWQLVQTRAALCQQLCTEHGFRFFHTTSLLGLGAALVEQGDLERGTALLREGWQERLALGATVNGSFWCALLSNAYARAGDFEQALDALDEAFARIDAHQERWWEPELHRQLGELALCAQPGASPRTRERLAARAAPEVAFERSLALACGLGAKSLELRAATSLARQWAATDRAPAARELLGGVLSWFREGFDTIDLKRASELLLTLDPC
ncbi:MAG: hypothetical protein RL685_5117 [Pseudomonadota bacterium]